VRGDRPPLAALRGREQQQVGTVIAGLDLADLTRLQAGDRRQRDVEEVALQALLIGRQHRVGLAPAQHRATGEGGRRRARLDDHEQFPACHPVSHGARA
jgi:hypothetical protein